MTLQLGNQPPIQNNEILNHFAQTWQMTRDVRSYNEYENDSLLKAIVPRLLVAGLLTFGTPVVIQDAPISYRPWLGVIGQAAALATLFRAHRKIKHRNENITSLECLQLATINGIEDAIRHQFEHPPQLNPDSLSIGLPYSSDIPVEDLAMTLARETSSGSLIVAPSGCGKTMFIRRAMIYAYQHYKGNVDFVGVDCKGDEDGWLGLESNPQKFCVMSDRQVPQGFALLKQIEARLDNLTPEYPTIALIDEWNNGISSAKKLDQAMDKADRQNYAGQMVLTGASIVTKGRSKKVYGWMTTHTPNTEKIGMDSSTRQSVNLIILARGNKVGLITSILKGKFDFVDDEEIRDALMLQWKAYRATNPDLEIPIALTNIGGQWRLVKLPDYRGELPRLFGGNEQGLNGAIDVQSLPVNSFSSYELDDEYDEWEEDSIAFDEDGDRVLDVAATAAAIDLDVELATAASEVLSQCLKRDATLAVRDLQRFGTVLRQMTADEIKAVILGLSATGYGVVANEQLAPSACTFTINKVHEQAIIYKLWQSYRKDEGSVEKFIKKVYGVEKLDDRYKSLMQQLFNAIEQHLHHWIPLLKREEMSIAKAVWKVWHRDSKMRWQDGKNNLSFNDLKQLLRNNGWSNEAESLPEELPETKEIAVNELATLREMAELLRKTEAHVLSANPRSVPTPLRHYWTSQIADRDGWTCHWCEIDLNKYSATLDHIIPYSKGGSWRMENLKLSCRDCNNKRGDMDYEEFKQSKASH